MNERSIETDIALLKQEAAATVELNRSIERSIERQTDIANNLTKLCAILENRVSVLENTAANTASSNQKIEDWIASVREQLMQIKLDNHVERDSKHKEVMAAIEKVRIGTSRDMDSKVEKLREDVNTSIDEIDEKINHLNRFQWMTMGVAAALSVETAVKLFGLL